MHERRNHEFVVLVDFCISSHWCCTLLPRASEANYGGRVTDAHDRITIANLVTDYYCEDILKERLEGGFNLPKFSLYIALLCLADLLPCMPRWRVKRKNGSHTLVFTLCQWRTATSSLSCDLNSCHRFGENCYRSLLFLHTIFLASSRILISGLAHIMLPSSNRWMAIWNISKLCPSTRCQRQVWGFSGRCRVGAQCCVILPKLYIDYIVYSLWLMIYIYMICENTITHIITSTATIFIDISSFQWPETEFERQGGTCSNPCQHMPLPTTLSLTRHLACMPMRTCPQPSRKAWEPPGCKHGSMDLLGKFTHEFTYQCVKDIRVEEYQVPTFKTFAYVLRSCTETIFPSIVHDP